MIAPTMIAPTMIALFCPMNSYVSTPSELSLELLMILSFPSAVLYILWRVFVPPTNLPGANLLGLDPEADRENRSGFCWSGTPILKPILYFILAVMTLIY
jgi:hypothetical protein